MTIENYLKSIRKEFSTGIAREHAYRPALKKLVEGVLGHGTTAVNDPARTECGAPDFIVRRGGIDIGYMETKDIGIDLNDAEKSDQMQRYADALDNLILTDYLEFRFYTQGTRVETVSAARLERGKIVATPENHPRLERFLRDFGAYQGQTITSAEKLAQMMAHKARLMKDVFLKVVRTTKPEQDNTLKKQYEAFKSILLHDMDPAQFADVYAQTIAYGLFTARFHGEARESFARSQALALIPKSNPFLLKLFEYVTGTNLDEKLVWIVDSLCEVFSYADVAAIMRDFAGKPGQDDPMLHFYETFLTAYDPGVRKSRGVWYTPQPVVGFIIRTVDEILKTEFHLPRGLADAGKTTIEIAGKSVGKAPDQTTTDKQTTTREVHRVQLLDVATGTGTFMAEAIKQIYKNFAGQEGSWADYVEKDLLPRLHGFEILMASYAMCHMKIDLLLKQTGYDMGKSNTTRLGAYLTNALEQHHPESDLPFTDWIASEANEASRVKRDLPIMVAFGNPPYSGHSANKNDYIDGLMQVYIKEPGGQIELQEKLVKWIYDDYVKFIRMAESFIQKNGEGILAFITNHSWLDNVTFRGMRWHLLKTFDKIYIMDLHGNAKKKETSPDGGKDDNVFDIQQGVAILLAVKTTPPNTNTNKTAPELATVYHHDLWGRRHDKYDFLENHHLDTIHWTALQYQAPDYFFIPKNYKLLQEYQDGFSLKDLFPVNSVGIVTARDHLTIHESKQNLTDTIEDFASLDVETARTKYKLGKDGRDWKVHLAQAELKNTELDSERIKQIAYRPFDTRWTYYTGKSKGFHCNPRGDVMQHMLSGENIALIVPKQANEHSGGFVSRFICGHKTYSAYNINYIHPLYVYKDTLGERTKVANLDPKIWAKIKARDADVSPERLFDYIYAVLHSPQYRQRYAEFLKSDFPRIPVPKDKNIFRKLATHGTILRELHLLTGPHFDQFTTTYPIAGNQLVEKPAFKKTNKTDETGRVYINPHQYFGNVPEIAWEFYIGGYQPAQKWLKDRKGRKLERADTDHYQKIIIALTRTHQVMQQINTINFLPTPQKETPQK